MGGTVPVTPRTAAAHVYVASLAEPALEDDDRHHLERVLRVRPGALITICDGQGGWRPVVLGSELTPAGDVVRAPRRQPAITVAFALVKGDRPELVARALTEIGVDEIVPMHTARTVVRWSGARGEAALERLRRVARSAGSQCRRVWLPDVAPVTAPATLLDGVDVALAVAGADPPSVGRPRVLVGPEGGWSPEELAMAPAVVGLGPHVLRTETAAIVAGTLLVAARERTGSSEW